jgi:uncharacterized SAM-binding protein YcdF (DUF218 family)
MNTTSKPKKRRPSYDLIIVPGLKLGPHWGLRRDMRVRLQKAAELYKENPGVHIAVSGRWSIWYDWLNIRPPITECKRMKNYLVRHGVKAQDVVMESQAKDTPGNAYYLKRYVRTKP